MSLLESCIVEITRRCPLASCVFCSSDSVPVMTDPLIHDLPDNIVMRLFAQELPEVGVKEVEVSGGEAVIRPRLLTRIVEELADRDIRVKLFTSGILIELIEVVITAIRDIGRDRVLELFEVHVSIHSLVPEIHARLAGIPSPERSREDLRTRLRTIHKLRQLGIRVGIHFTVTKLNYLEIEDVVKVAQGLGAFVVSLLRLVPQGRASFDKNWRFVALSPEDWAKFFKQVRELAKRFHRFRFGCPINWWFLIDEELAKLYPAPHCPAGETHIAIEPDGSVIPCSAFKGLKGKYTFGNVKESSLIDILNSESRARFVHEKRTRIPEKCRICRHFNVCRAKCFAQRLYANPDEPDPLCQILHRYFSRY